MANAFKQLAALLKQLPPITPVWADYGTSETGVLSYQLMSHTRDGSENSNSVPPQVYAALENVFQYPAGKPRKQIGIGGLQWTYQASSSLSREQALAKCGSEILRERGIDS